MNNFDLYGRLNQIFNPQQMLQETMPTMARGAFGDTSPVSSFAATLPDMGGGGQGLMPPVAPAMPDMGGAQGMLPTPAPALPDMGGAQGLTPPAGLLDAPVGGPSLQTIGDKMMAFGRAQAGQQGQGQQRQGPHYAPVPNVMSAGPVGGRAGADINILQFARGLGRR